MTTHTHTQHAWHTHTHIQLTSLVYARLLACEPSWPRSKNSVAQCSSASPTCSVQRTRRAQAGLMPLLIWLAQSADLTER